MEFENAQAAKEACRLAWAKVESLPSGSAQWKHALVLARNAEADLWRAARTLHLVRGSWIRQWNERCGDKGFFVMDSSAVDVAHSIFGETLPQSCFRKLAGTCEDGFQRWMFKRSEMDFN